MMLIWKHHTCSEYEQNSFSHRDVLIMFPIWQLFWCFTKTRSKRWGTAQRDEGQCTCAWKGPFIQTVHSFTCQPSRLLFLCTAFISSVYVTFLHFGRTQRGRRGISELAPPLPPLDCQVMSMIPMCRGNAFVYIPFTCLATFRKQRWHHREGGCTWTLPVYGYNMQMAQWLHRGRGQEAGQHAYAHFPS